MDRALYIAMTGAGQTLQSMGVTSHNLANASTAGFRAEIAQARAEAIQGNGMASRYNTVDTGAGFDGAGGALRSTGRDLDIALRGNGWLTVQTPDGGEALTRAGNLQVNAAGQLLTGSGLPVMGDGGPIAVPPHSSMTIGSDGTLTIVPQGVGPETTATVGRLKVVDARAEQLERRADGLFQARPGEDLLPVAGDSVVPGALESSNVNVAQTLVEMIELSRKFEMQVRMMRTVEDNAKAGASLLRQT
jgi:flagellar basal-body rod protein FlgF